jgi:hypothetical protein
MDRRETERETKATKNTKNVWKWILGIGAVLMIFAFFGGYFNHDKNFSGAQGPSTRVADTIVTDRMDTTQQLHPDSIMNNVRGTK